jgi:putative endonuclease
LAPDFWRSPPLQLAEGPGETSAMYYVYLMQSSVGHRYVGFTEDLKKRLWDHNKGILPNTARYRPWHLKTYLAFSCKKQALGFEQYIKHGSGHAFARKRLWLPLPS